LTFLRVLWARATPALSASSKLFVEDALISVTRAIDVGELLFIEFKLENTFDMEMKVSFYRILRFNV
jgi:hypothetical protein